MDLINISRSIKNSPIDVIVVYTIFASAQKTGYSTRVRTRIEGRLLNIKSGERLGGFAVELPEPANAPIDCNYDCIIDTVAQNADILGQDLGAVLVLKLDGALSR